MGRYQYDLGDTSYVQWMNDMTMQYNIAIRNAEMARNEKGGPSKKEAACYKEAIETCNDIINRNLSQRDVASQWKRRKAMCEEEFQNIMEELSPALKYRAAQASADPADQAEASARAPRTARNAQKGAPEGAEQTTKDGFVTKNACKDVPADTIATWYKDKPRHGLSDVSGMEKIKAELMLAVGDIGWEKLDATLGISPVQSFFFYGLPGTGKTFIIEAFASEMMDKGFKFIRLLGGDIHASLVGVAEKTVEIAMKEAIDNEPCIIFIDEIENVCVNRSSGKAEGHEKRLTVAFLEAYNLLKESGKRVVFMGATNYPTQVDEAMFDRVKVIPIPLPPVEARESFFERKFNGLMFEEDCDVAYMADMTDGYSYRDLERLVETIKFNLKKQLIEDSTIVAHDGEIDKEKTQDAALESLEKGVIRVDSYIFEQALRSCKPSDKTTIREEIRKFEDRMREMRTDILEG